MALPIEAAVERRIAGAVEATEADNAGVRIAAAEQVGEQLVVRDTVGVVGIDLDEPGKSADEIGTGVAKLADAGLAGSWMPW